MKVALFALLTAAAAANEDGLRASGADSAAAAVEQQRAPAAESKPRTLEGVPEGMPPEAVEAYEAAKANGELTEEEIADWGGWYYKYTVSFLSH